MDDDDYLDLNRASWDERAPAHAASPDYNLQGFIDDPAYVGNVVQFDRPLLGDLSGLRGVHLQCHIGTDTVGLSRLGARMTGLDFSPAAIEQARALVATTGDEVSFVESDVYDAEAALNGEKFDLVFTGIGALCWLPSISHWAATVAALLKPGGRLFIREGHPMLWSLADSRPDGLLVVDFPYFERDEATVFDDGGTYVETDVVFTANTTHSWNHGLGEIMTALIGEGMQVTSLVEHDSVPWDAFPGQMSKDDRSEWRLTDQPWRLAASYTLQAVKLP
ncbi:MAG: class I SAM-dependent methyltransferase [Dermatophilaceae bacterium]